MADDKKKGPRPVETEPVKDEGVDELVGVLRAAQVRLRDLNAKRQQVQSQANALDVQVTEQRQEISRIEQQLLLAARGRDG